MESLHHFNVFRKKKQPPNEEYENFLKKKTSIIWVMGPKSCGNASISSLLAESIKFQLIDVSKLLVLYSLRKETFPKADLVAKCMEKGKLVPDDTVIHILKEEILLTYGSVEGFVISGFPRNASQMKLFAEEIRDVNVIIHINLKLDAFLARVLFDDSKIDMGKAKMKFMEYNKKLKSVRKKYEDRIIDVKYIFPKEDAVARLLDILEDDFRFDFKRV